MIFGRWSAQIIPWHDLLLLLEEQNVYLPAPKTNLAKDIEFSRGTPIFCTCNEELCSVRDGVLDQTESQMMRVRWKIFAFHFQIPGERATDCPNLSAF